MSRCATVFWRACRGLQALGMTVFIVARPRQRFAEPEKTSLSVVVPMRNEEGNVAAGARAHSACWAAAPR